MIQIDRNASCLEKGELTNLQNQLINEQEMKKKDKEDEKTKSQQKANHARSTIKRNSVDGVDYQDPYLFGYGYANINYAIYLKSSKSSVQPIH